jgi:hypothetical protein
MTDRITEILQKHLGYIFGIADLTGVHLARYQFRREMCDNFPECETALDKHHNC